MNKPKLIAFTGVFEALKRYHHSYGGASVHGANFAARGIITTALVLARSTVRAFGLIAILVAAIGDAVLVWLMTEPTGSRLAHARANWFHRWSWLACHVLG